MLLHNTKNRENNPSYLADTVSLQSKKDRDSRSYKAKDQLQDTGVDNSTDSSISSDKSIKTLKRDLKRTTYDAMKNTLKEMESMRSMLLDPALLTSGSIVPEGMSVDAIIREKRKAVMDSIKNFSKVATVREDYRPPKEPRNFIQENIENIRKMSTKIKEASLRVHKGPNVFGTHYYYLPWYQSPKQDGMEDSRHGLSITDGWAHPLMASMQPMRIRRYSLNGWRSLMQHYWEKIKLLAKEGSENVDNESHKAPDKCDCCICYALAKRNIKASLIPYIPIILLYFCR